MAPSSSASAEPSQKLPSISSSTQRNTHPRSRAHSKVSVPHQDPHRTLAAEGHPSVSSNPWGLVNTSSQPPRHSSSEHVLSPNTYPQSSSSRPSSGPMFCPPSISYDPDQPVPTQEGEEYQRWVEAYSHDQFDYDRTGDVTQVAYPQPDSHSSIPAPDVTHGGSTEVQNQYVFAQGEFMPSSQPQGNPYTQQFVQARSGEQHPDVSQASIAQRYTHPEQHMNPLPVDYTTSQQHQQVSVHSQAAVVSSAMHHQYQQQQQYMPQRPEPYVQPHQMQQAGSSHSMPYYFQPASREYVAGAGQQPPQAFTFAHYAAGSEHLSAPNSTHPSPDPTSFASSMSPSSRAGTDDGQSHHSLAPKTSPQPTKPQALKPAPTSRLSPHQGGNAKRGRAPAGGSKSKSHPSKRRKRSNPPPDSDSGTDEEEFISSQSVLPPLKGPDNVPSRLPGACSHCKKLKMKCDFPIGENTCRRCLATGHHCIVEGRKPRNTPNKREYLLAQIRQKDAVIESLLKQLHNPYLATPLSVASYRMATSPSDQNNRNVLAWLDRLEASVRTAGKSGGAKAFGLGSRVHAGEADDHSDGESDRGDQHEPTERGTVVGKREGPADNDDDGGDLQPAAPDDSVPMGLIANLSLNNSKKKSAKLDDDESEDEDDVGFANETYFEPGPAYDLSIRAHMIEQNTPPEILVHGLVTPHDVDNLFKIYYARLNVHVSLLDPELHTPASTFTRCPFLFTVVCAVASRYYSEKSEIYPIAMHFAKHAAANALITGWKSVELAQAYILLSVFTVPERRWEEHRGWLYIGLAARLATDLNLHQVSPVKPTTERQEREMLNRIRLWLNCYTLDRSTATQYGKPYSIKEDYIIRTSANWYLQSKYIGPYDIGLCAYVAMLRIVSRFHDEVFSDPDSPSGLNLQLDFLELTTTHDSYLNQFYNEWSSRFNNDSDLSDQACAFRADLLPFLTSYARLVMYSFGFQQAYRRGMQGRDQVFLDKCYQYATTVVTCMIDKLAPSGYMRYSPDGHFVFATFASAFLLKLLKPEFSELITKQQHDDIFDMIGRLIHTFSSAEIAIDERHTPKLHARFLTTLLSKHRKDVSSASLPAQQQPPQHSQRVAGGSSGTHTSSASPDPGASPYQTSPQGQTQQSPSGPAGMPQGQQQTYPGSYDYSAGPSHAQAFQYTEPMESFDDELLGALQVLKTPGYWQTMMMPGFQWAETQARPGFAPPTPAYHQSIPGINGIQAGRNPLQTAGLQYS